MPPQAFELIIYYLRSNRSPAPHETTTTSHMKCKQHGYDIKLRHWLWLNKCISYFTGEKYFNTNWALEYACLEWKKNTNLCSKSSTNFVCPLSAAIVRAVSRDEGTGGAFTSAPLSSSTLPTSTYPPLAASMRGVSPVFARCSTFAFRSSRRLTTSCRPKVLHVLKRSYYNTSS